MSKAVLVTGAAGFIGFHVANALHKRGDKVVGIDDFNAYYDVELKKARVTRLELTTPVLVEKQDIADAEGMRRLFERHAPTHVVHLAAQAGVRYSLTNPMVYAHANLAGFLSVLEACRHGRVAHLVYASSSSVYGANTKMPYAATDAADHPVSLYAATKGANELMAHAYAHLYGLPCTGLRFFTVYGPWGRPDMAYYLFTKAILAGETIRLFNHGRMRRDFTYVDDVVDGILRALDRPAAPDPAWDPAVPSPASSHAPWRVYNIGNHDPVELIRFVEVLEGAIGRETKKEFLPMQPGDVPATYADIGPLHADTGFWPKTSIEEGLARFVAWYREYHRV